MTACRKNSIGDVVAPGDYFIDRTRADRPALFLIVPGDKIPSRLPLWNNGGEHWEFSGTDDKPTLSPSINCPGTWHGYLTEGVFR